ncbi:MAG TPA: ASKHA domain-containing protein, partial [Verrucomicrobiae bacterium]|nr:ASKHA domain-containing protein [Verrucomicrobiae bacterium]
HSIGQNPYQSLTELEMAEGKRHGTGLVESAKRLALPLHPKARVVGLPIISGHVGADAAACLLAIDIAHEDRLVALMDIGTNTELILGNKHKILAASCPAGPAFEGGKISCGMPGLDGAVEKVKMRSDGTFEVEVIGGGPAQGICGSGLVDLLAELRRHGRMNALGRFEEDEKPIVIAGAGEDEVYLTEGDVNELAQAKGANVAGLKVVFDRYGAPFGEVDIFYLAGGFGQNLDASSSRRIGLIPDIPDANLRQVGNASIEGATIALLSRRKRRELDELVGRIQHCRLETHPDFFNFFVEGCQFDPVAAAPALTT